MKIVCLEGCSGTGKTTQYHLLNQYYARSRLKHIAVVEKDYEPFKSVVKEWHNTKSPDILFTEEEVRKFSNARYETFLRNFSFLEAELDLILMDRYFYTSAVYQRNCGLNPKEILQMNIGCGAPVPDLTFLFDCDPQICFERANNRNKKTGGRHLFSTSPKKIEEIRENYLYLVQNRGEVKVINTDKPISEITCSLVDEIARLF
ncbi:thymidylate kinase [Candidatus Woesearchaeota archaeon]|nr:thymidylate kinase [Candidatus Woesearchaeota archaeon]